MSVRLSSVEHGNTSGRLAARRKARHNFLYIASAVVMLIVLGAAVYGLWQDQVRVSHVVIYGADQSLSLEVLSAMHGSYFGIIPSDSIFFIPESKIRSSIMDNRPEIAAVSIFRNGFSGLSIKIDYRVPIAEWCGATFNPTRFDLGNSDLRSNLVGSGECYFFDSSGFIFATSSASVKPVNSFFVYIPHEITESVIGTFLPNAEKFPRVFDLAREISTLGQSVSSIIFRDDEVDIRLGNGIRITYILSREQDAFSALVSASPSLSLNDKTIEYIDLRFEGKVYLKRK